MNLALFDFDGTITFNDNFVDFVHFAVDPKRVLLGKLVLSPLILGYKLGVVPPARIRQRVAAFAFRGQSEEKLKELGASYARQVIPKRVRPVALERIHWHRARGDTVVVVSASLDLYLSEWCKNIGIDWISTELQVKDGYFTGEYRHGDCAGVAKASRIRERYRVGDYPTIYAYGDTEEDREMLRIAGKRYFQWKEIS